jgi:hypothetical protein
MFGNVVLTIVGNGGGFKQVDLFAFKDGDLAHGELGQQFRGLDGSDFAVFDVEGQTIVGSLNQSKV